LRLAVVLYIGDMRFICASEASLEGAASYFLICDDFNENSLKHSMLILPGRAPQIIFQNFASICIPKNEAQKVKKRDLGIFRVEKHVI